MADWTTPENWTVGEVPPAAKFNEQIRDNLTFLFEPFHDVELGDDASDHEITGVPDVGQRLIVRVQGWSTAEGPNRRVVLNMRLNGETGSNVYREVREFTSGELQSSDARLFDVQHVGYLTDDTIGPNVPGNSLTTVERHRFGRNKLCHSVGWVLPGGAVSEFVRREAWWRFQNNSPVTSVQLFPVSGDLKAGTVITAWVR